MSNYPSDHESEISLITEVKVGKSYKSKGWTVKKEDFGNLIPAKKYEGNCHIKVNDIISQAKISFGLRLFYNNKNNLKNHLENLYKKDPNTKIPLEFKLKPENLYKNIISKYSDAKPLKTINLELFVGKSYKSKGWKMSKEFNSIFIPVKEYPEKFDILVDEIPTDGRLEIGTRLFYKNDELSSYLKKLYENDENSRINATLIFDDELIVYDLENNYKKDQLIKNSFRKKETKTNDKNDTTNLNTKELGRGQLSNYDKIKHSLFIDAIKNGKSVKEAATIIDISARDIKKWYNLGREGISPFNSFFNDYNQVKTAKNSENNPNIKPILNYEKESKINLIIIEEYENSYEVMIKGKIKKNLLMDNLDSLKDFQNKINKILINGKEDMVEILIELKISEDKLNSLKILINEF